MGRVACLAHFFKNAVDSVGGSLVYQKMNSLGYNADLVINFDPLNEWSR